MAGESHLINRFTDCKQPVFTWCFFMTPRPLVPFQFLDIFGSWSFCQQQIDICPFSRFSWGLKQEAQSRERTSTTSAMLYVVSTATITSGCGQDSAFQAKKCSVPSNLLTLALSSLLYGEGIVGDGPLLRLFFFKRPWNEPMVVNTTVDRSGERLQWLTSKTHYWRSSSVAGWENHSLLLALVICLHSQWQWLVVDIDIDILVAITWVLVQECNPA